MTEHEASLRESLISTLEFLASEQMQREFAEKVFYRSYQDEFACWWFDTFFPEDQSTTHMFNEHQIAELKQFSSIFDANLCTINDEYMPIEQLLANPQWKEVVESAQKAIASIQNAT